MILAPFLQNHDTIGAILMAIDQTIDSLGGVSVEELYGMNSAEFQALLGSVMTGLDESAKAEKYQEIKTDMEDVGEIVNAQRYALRDLSSAAKREGDLGKAAEADRLLEELDGISEFIDEFSSSWGEVDKTQGELNQVMTSTGFQINYSSLNAVSGSVITVDATGLASAGGIFGDDTATAAADRPYAILNLNPGDVISGEPVLNTSTSPCTLSIPISNEDGSVTRMIVIEASSADAMPAIKLNGSIGGLTEDEISSWPSNVRELFYESVTAEHNFQYGVTGREEGSLLSGGKFSPGKISKNGNLADQLKSGGLVNRNTSSTTSKTKGKKVAQVGVKAGSNLQIGNVLSQMRNKDENA